MVDVETSGHFKDVNGEERMDPNFDASHVLVDALHLNYNAVHYNTYPKER